MSEKFSLKWEDFLRQKKKLDEDKTFQDEIDDLAAVQEALFLLVNTPKVSSSKEDKKVTLSEEISEPKVVKKRKGDNKKKTLPSFQSDQFESVEELDQKIEEMMERIESSGRYRCLTCGRDARNRGHMKEHMEIHFEGLSFSCQNCDKIFRSRAVFRNHCTRHNCRNQ